MQEAPVSSLLSKHQKAVELINQSEAMFPTLCGISSKMEVEYQDEHKFRKCAYKMYALN